MEKLKNYCISMGIFFLTLIILLFIASLVFAYTNLKDNYIEPVIYFSIGFSSFISSLILCRSIKKNGIVNGIIINIVALCILFIISSILNQKMIFTNTLGIYFLIVCITGALGGILGVNV